MATTEVGLTANALTDNTEGAISRYLGKNSHYVMLLRKNKEETYRYIMTLGKGQFIMGHARYLDDISVLMAELGQLYWTLKDADISPKIILRKYKHGKSVENRMWSAFEKALDIDVYRDALDIRDEFHDVAKERRLF